MSGFFSRLRRLLMLTMSTQLFVKNESENLGEIAIIVKTYIQVFMIAGMVILIRTFFKNDFLFFVDVSDLCNS